MVSSNSLLIAQKSNIPADEYHRLHTISTNKCNFCNGFMTTGDDEAAGICSTCYWDNIETFERN